MTKSTDASPDFSPSILHNKSGPLRPTAEQAPNPLLAHLPPQVGVVLADKRAVALVCLFLPPLAVFLRTGFGRKFGLSLILFAFFIVPGIENIIFICLLTFAFLGIIYAFYVSFLESALNPSDSVYEV